MVTALSFERFDVLFLDVKFQYLASYLGQKNTGIPIVGLVGPEEQWSESGVDGVSYKRDAIRDCVKMAKVIMSERF